MRHRHSGLGPYYTEESESYDQPIATKLPLCCEFITRSEILCQAKPNSTVLPDSKTVSAPRVPRALLRAQTTASNRLRLGGVYGSVEVPPYIARGT